MRQLICILLFLASFCFLSASHLAWAGNNRADIEKFYKPVTQRDMIVVLPPRTGGDNRFASSDAVFSGNGGCPDQINIGSVTDETTIVGSADINVAIQGDIIVQCGSGF